MQAHIFSRGLFQAGAWSSLAASSYKKVHAAIMYVYRSVLGLKQCMLQSDDQIINELRVICPMTLIRIKRLILFAKVSKCPVTLDACKIVAGSKCSWACAVLEDLEWLTMFPHFSASKGIPTPRGLTGSVVTLVVLRRMS